MNSGAGHFDGVVAETYDDLLGWWGTDEAIFPAADRLAELAGGGRALEFAIGTGRIALPLAARGVEVHGLELSDDMVAQLRSKPGGEGLPISMGDMASTTVDGQFSLVYLVFNTITNLLTQAEQVRCFQNASAHLAPGGRFVIEVYVPRLRLLAPGVQHLPFDVTDEHLGVDHYDVVEQRLTSYHYWPGDGRLVTHSTPHRYAWPAEYDLMAQLAGMDLEHRWADWTGAPFTADSKNHVSVYRRPE